MLHVEQPAAKGKAAKKAPANGKGKAKTTKAKPKGKKGMNDDDSVGSLVDFIADDDEIEYAKKGKKKPQTKK